MSESATEHSCEWRAEAAALKVRADAADARVAELQEQVAALTKALYGKKSEKMPRPTDELRRNGKVPPPDAEAVRQKREDQRA